MPKINKIMPSTKYSQDTTGAVDTVSKFLTEREIPFPNWVNAKEAVPDDGRWVLMVYLNNNNIPSVYVNRYFPWMIRLERRGFWEHHNCKPIKWMELPNAIEALAKD